MGHPIGTAAVRHHDHDADADPGWSLVQAAARAAEGLAGGDTCQSFALAPDGQLRAGGRRRSRRADCVAPRRRLGRAAAARRSAPRLHRSLSADLQRDHGPADHGGTSGPEPGRIHRHACRRIPLDHRRAEHHSHASPPCVVRCGRGRRRHGCGRRSAAHHPARRRPEPVACRDRSRPASRRPLPRLH